MSPKFSDPRFGLPRNQLREIHKAWDKATFNSLDDAIEYHYLEHGTGQNLLGYTREAQQFLEVNKALAQPHPLEDSRVGIKIRTKTHYGIYTKDDKIVSYGPR